MKTLTVNIEDILSEKAIAAVLNALKINQEIDDDTQNDTERVKADPYLSDKIEQCRENMEAGIGASISLDYLQEQSISLRPCVIKNTKKIS